MLKTRVRRCRSSNFYFWLDIAYAQPGAFFFFSNHELEKFGWVTGKVISGNTESLWFTARGTSASSDTMCLFQCPECWLWTSRGASLHPELWPLCWNPLICWPSLIWVCPCCCVTVGLRLQTGSCGLYLNGKCVLLNLHRIHSFIYFLMSQS